MMRCIRLGLVWVVWFAGDVFDLGVNFGVLFGDWGRED